MIPRSLALLVVVAAPLAAQQLPSRAVASRLVDSLAIAFVAERQSPSVAIALVRGGDTLAFNAWGKANIENDVAATKRSVYRIGSVTKQFTAAAVMQLVEQGKVKLDDSVAAYLAGLPAAWRPVTIRQLLNHTSGIPSYTDIGPAWVRRWAEEMTPDTLVALTAAKPMDFAPGTSWKYDNTGYVLLGMVVEKVAARSWATDLTERFFKPLGLSDTRNCLVQPLIPRRATGYQPTADGWENAVYLAMTQPYSAGALCSTIGDLTTWNRALHGGKVVSVESYKLMTTPSGPAATAALKYGFGLGRATIGQYAVITHGGGIHGFITANAWIPELQLSITVLTNSGAARADDLMAQVVRAAVGIPLVRPQTVVESTAPQRAKYVGTYALALPGAVRNLTVSERDGELYGQMEGQGANQMLFYGNDTWGMSFDPQLRVVFEVKGDKAAKITLKQGGGSFEGPRKP